MFDSDGTLGSNFESGYCVGAINAVGSLSELLNGAITKEKQFSLPKTMTNIQGTRIIAKYLTDDPSILHYLDGYAVLIAYQTFFLATSSKSDSLISMTDFQISVHMLLGYVGRVEFPLMLLN